MEAKKITQKINEISKMVQGWSDDQNVSVLEKEIVLEKLRNIYDAIYFGASEVVSQKADYESELTSEVATKVVAKVAEPELIAPEIVVAQEPEPEAKQEVCVKEQVDEPKEADIETLGEPYASKIVALGVVELIRTENEEQMQVEAEADLIADQIIDNPEQVATQQDAVVEQVEVKQEPRKPAFESQSLFEPEQIAVKKKIDHKVILSLYGDAPEQEVVATKVESAHQIAEQEPARVNVEPEVVVAEPEKVAESSYVQPQISIEVSEPKAVVSIPENKEVLGDVIGGNKTILADSVSALNENVTDLASKIVNSNNGQSLRKMIGLNDKFLLIRDLFAGDADSYERTITALDELTSLDDALIYIYENFSDWDANCDGSKLLSDLLTRKL